MQFRDHKFHGCVDSYSSLTEIDFSIIPTKLKKLPFFEDDIFLGMQAMNIGLVDQLITQYEYSLLQEYHEIDRTPDSTMSISAISQMWIYSTYEVFRMWRDRKFEFEKLNNNGGIQSKINSMIDDPNNLSTNLRKKQMLRFQQDAEYRECINNAWSGMEEIYRAVELVRINLAKHCAPGRNNIIPTSPGYARINEWCGAMDYQVIDGDRYYTYLNRRDIADGIRNFLVGFNS